MSEPSIKSPDLEKLFNFQLSPAIKRKHSIASSCTEFNTEDQEMAGVTEQAFDFTPRNTHNQVSENQFLNSSGLIKIHCRKPIVLKTSNLDHISLIPFGASDDVAITSFHLDVSTIISFMFGGTGTAVATLIPESSSRTGGVKRSDDAEPSNGNMPRGQNDVHHQNNANGNGAVHANADNNNGGNGNENGNGANQANAENNNGGYGNENGDGNGDDDQLGDKITIYIVEVYVGSWSVAGRHAIKTNIIADDFDSWEAIAGAVYQKALEVEGDNTDNLLAPADELMNPYYCWPGLSITGFGWFEENGPFQPLNWPQYPWQLARFQIKAVLVFRFLIRPL